jgi:hypothetical protein
MVPEKCPSCAILFWLKEARLVEIPPSYRRRRYNLPSSYLDCPERTPCNSNLRSFGGLCRIYNAAHNDHSQHCCIAHSSYDFAWHISLRLPHLRNTSPLDADHYTPKIIHHFALSNLIRISHQETPEIPRLVAQTWMVPASKPTKLF